MNTKLAAFALGGRPLYVGSRGGRLGFRGGLKALQVFDDALPPREVACLAAATRAALALDGAAAIPAGYYSPGRVCHQVTVLIQTRLMPPVTVCIFERVWIWIAT